LGLDLRKHLGRVLRLRRPPISSGSSTFSSAQRQGRSAPSWNTKPSARSILAWRGVRPNTLSVPLEGAIRSATTRSSVDFPHPDGPRTHRKPPASTENEILSSAVTVRRSVTKRIETF
jgi:hypothetical protein